MRHFKQVTMGCPVIMGRSTWESLRRPLAGRTNIVLTTKEDYEVIGGETAHSARQALQFAQRSLMRSDAPSEGGEDALRPRIMIIGGEAVYRTFLPITRRLHLTLVQAKLEGDTRFPHIDLSEWVESSREDHQADDENPYDFSFIVLDRIMGSTAPGTADDASKQGGSSH
jgi:dihydrofolate reductase